MKAEVMDNTAVVSKGMRIRPARHEDAAGFISAHVRSIREVCSEDYSPSQIEAWSGRDFREDLWRDTMDRDTVLAVETDDGSIAGFCHWAMHEDTGVMEIEGFYLVPEVIGNGLGKACVAQVLNDAVARDAAAVKVVSTLTAEPFYRVCGFRDSGDTATYAFNGVEVECRCLVMDPPFTGEAG